MNELICAQVIAGEINKLLLREKAGKKIEIGDLLVIENQEGKIILQVFNLLYGSQLSQLAREQISGLTLENISSGLQFLDPELRKYILAEAKPVLKISDEVYKPKLLPDLFDDVRNITVNDLSFLRDDIEDSIYLGDIRSGSKVIPISLNLASQDLISHHVLVCATTGRGKSNLIKNMVWNCIGKYKVGFLILDPHNEYYGRNNKGLKDHDKAKEGVEYYSINPPPGGFTLIINLNSIKIEHFEGIIKFSDPQEQIMEDYVHNHRDEWLSHLILEDLDALEDRNLRRSLRVLQRKFRTKLSLFQENNRVVSRNRVFSSDSGLSTISAITNSLEAGKIVIIDTSKVGEETELLVGSIIANEIKWRYEEANSIGTLDNKVPVGIIIEEAPRVLSKENRENIYSTIAKEGRKFKIGLIAITQLVSVIPTEILTNINTKIILGNEMANERRTLIQNAAQDLSDEEKNIASLDKGEAIVTSIFTKFAVPIKIPLFEKKFSDNSNKKIKKIKYG